MIPLTDCKRWIWPSNWPHCCPSKGNTAKWAVCLHTSPYQIKRKDTLTKNRISKTHTSQLCCLFCSWISPKTLRPPSQPPPPYPDTNKHTCKQTGRRANHACTHKLCLSGARHDWKCPCGSVTRETQPRQTRRRVVGARCGRGSCKPKPHTAKTAAAENVAATQQMQLAWAELHHHVPLLSPRRWQTIQGWKRKSPEFNGFFWSFFLAIIQSLFKKVISTIWLSPHFLIYIILLRICTILCAILQNIHKIHQTSVESLSSPMVSFKWAPRKSGCKRWYLKSSYWG